MSTIDEAVSLLGGDDVRQDFVVMFPTSDLDLHNTIDLSTNRVYNDPDVEHLYDKGKTYYKIGDQYYFVLLFNAYELDVDELVDTLTGLGFKDVTSFQSSVPFDSVKDINDLCRSLDLESRV